MAGLMPGDKSRPTVRGRSATSAAGFRAAVSILRAGGADRERVQTAFQAGELEWWWRRLRLHGIDQGRYFGR